MQFYLVGLVLTVEVMFECSYLLQAELYGISDLPPLALSIFSKDCI